MKKITSTLIVSFFLLSAAFGENVNNLKVWSVDSDAYRYLTYLYMAECRALPDSAGPWSNAELLLMFSKLEGTYEDEKLNELYEKTYLLLNESPTFTKGDGFAFNLKGTFNPELYIHTDSTDFTEEDDWYYDFEKRQPLLEADAEVFAGKSFYGYLGIPLENNSSNESGQYTRNFVTNIPCVTGTGIESINVNFPDRSFITAGGDHWDFSAGRDVIRWGNGETGNLLLGGNQKYDNNLRFETYFDSFKFNTVAIFYPHSEMEESGSTSQEDSTRGLKFFLGHRLGFRFLDDRLNFSLSESIMYQNADGKIDFSLVNPISFYHNLFIRGNANSMMALDLDFAVTKGLNIYGETVLDELAFIGEPSGEDESTLWRPNKMGYLLGTKGIIPLKEGLLKLSLEGVYTDPYLYLREQYNSEEKTTGVSYYGSLREFSNGSGIYYLRKCIGYAYGGDAVVGDFRATFDTLEKWQAGLEIFYMAHGIVTGEKDLTDDYIYGKASVSPSTSDKTNTYEDGEIEHILRFGINGSYSFLSWLKAYGGIDNYIIWNKNNESSPAVYDFQSYAGLSFTIR